jgi:hypothetical protein
VTICPAPLIIITQCPSRIVIVVKAILNLTLGRVRVGLADLTLTIPLTFP